MDTTQRGTKFGLLCLTEASAGITGDIDLAATPGEVVAHSTCPIALPGQWERWLGELKTADITGANLSVAIQIASPTPDILDAEMRTLEQRAERLWHGLRLNGIPGYKAAHILIGGITNAGDLRLRNVAKLGLSYKHRFGIPLTIDEAVLRRAVPYGDALQSIFTMNPDFRRLRAGYLALASGIEEPQPEERLHQFVRALDGLMALGPRQGQTVFAERGQTFVDSADVENDLRQMYVLRNTQEHLNDFRAAVAAPNEQEFLRRFSMRGYQAQHTALAVYRRLAEQAALRGRFVSDQSTVTFWALPDGTRGQIWGTKVDLDAVQAEHDARFTL